VRLVGGEYHDITPQYHDIRNIAKCNLAKVFGRVFLSKLFIAERASNMPFSKF
jgi:hypothetical protein